MCMTFLLQQLQKNNHLKYDGRGQLGLFLKGCGLSLSDSLKFWRQSFSKITGDAFEKEYAYNIRHQYGKEGKKCSYTPWSCSYIIKQIPSSGCYHGCPFRYFDEASLKTLLQGYKLSDSAIRTIQELANGHYYQVISFIQAQT